jgi:hypothetical protein
MNLYGVSKATKDAIKGPKKRKGQAKKKAGKGIDPALENIEKSASSAFVRIEEEIKQEESVGELDIMTNHAGLLHP